MIVDIRRRLRFQNISLQVWLLFGALLAGGFYRIYGLSAVPLGFDEASSLLIARSPAAEIFELNKWGNSSPPLMLLILHGLLRFGDAEWMVRLMSVVAGLALIPAVYALAAEFGGKTSAGFAALLVALAPCEVELSREYRVYALGALFAALAALAALRYWRRPGTGRASVLALLFFAGVQVQYALMPFYGALIVALTAAGYPTDWPVRRRLGHLALISGLCALSMAAVYQVALKYQFYGGRGASYAPAIASPSVVHTLARVLLGTWKIVQYGFSSDVFVLLAGAGLAMALLRDWRNPLVLATLSSFAIFAILAVPNLYPYGPVRQCLVLLTPLYPLAAFGAVSLWGGRPRAREVCIWACAAVALAVPSVLAAVDTFGRPLAASLQGRNNFRAAMDAIDHNFRDGDVMFVMPGAFPSYDYYSRRYRPRPWIKAEGAELWMRDERSWRSLMGKEPPYTGQLRQLLNRGGRVWLLNAHYLPGEMRFSELAARYGWWSRTRIVMNADEIHLLLYE